MRVFWKLVKSNATQTFRDRMALFWFLAFPVVFIILFGAIFSGDFETASFQVGLVRGQNSQLAEVVESAFAHVPVFRIAVGDDLQDELRALQQGKRRLVVQLAEPTASQGPPSMQVQVYYDGSDQNSKTMLLPLVQRVFDELEVRLLERPRLFTLKPRPVQVADLRQIDYLLPGILAMAIMQLGLFGAVRIVNLREQKILKRLAATPLPRHLFLASEVTVRLAMAVVQTLAIVIIGHLAFDVQVVGSWAAVFGLVLLGACTFVSLGYMLVSFASSEEGANGIVQLVQFPMMFLSGIFFPVEVMPAFLKPILRILPLTYLADALRQVMVKAAPLYSLPLEVAVLGAYLLVTLMVAARFFRWEQP